MTVTTPMPARNLNLVVPLAHEATAMRSTETASLRSGLSGAVSPLIGESLRQGDVDSTMKRSTPSRAPGARTSTTASSSTTASRPQAALASSADTDLFEQLAVAYIDCRRTKRSSASALAFEDHVERNLCALHDELIDGSYQPGRSICFVITRPKPREVWAAEFRDRIIHHLLYNKIAPRFLSSFTADTCACIPGRGTLYAAKRLEAQVRSITQNWSQPAHYLKCDLANFFVSIDKRVLHDPRSDVEVRGRAELLQLVPPHKRLFNAPAEHGLPIGNLSSQFFANVLLNDLDQFAKHQLRAPTYVRYVDDFVLVHRSPQWLHSALTKIDAFLPDRLGVRLNPSKTILQPVDRGIDFVGHVLKVEHAEKRIQTIDRADLLQVANSYFGLLGQASHSHADRARLANALRKRGKSVKADLTKTYGAK